MAVTVVNEYSDLIHISYRASVVRSMLFSFCQKIIVMKKFQLSALALLLTLLSSELSFGWGTDKIITTAAVAQHSMAAKQNGTLYAAVPVLALTGFYETTLWISSDNGATWSPNSNATVPSAGLSPVVKTKIVVTSSDSVICMVLQNSTVYLVNLETGVMGQFTQSGVKDFDAAAGSQNFIYLFVNEAGNNSIRRYGTNDGGLTWTGNTAQVTGSGNSPRVAMSGTRLILNYYGPVLPDTTSSVIRAAFYDETAAGTLQPGTFSDVVTNTAVKKKQFQSVINNGNVWFFFTEGDAQQVVKCRVSTNNGSTYQPEIIIGGNAQVSASWFAAAPNNDPFGTLGVAITFLTDSINSPSNTFDKMIFAAASGSNPSAFSIPPSPFNTYNDTSAVSAATPVIYPVLVNYAFNTIPETGIAWLGAHATLPLTIYFDRYTETVGITETPDSFDFNVYPSPASDHLNLSIRNNSGIREIIIYSSAGSAVIRRNLSDEGTAGNQNHRINIQSLSNGIYYLTAWGPDGRFTRKFTVSR